MIGEVRARPTVSGRSPTIARLNNIQKMKRAAIALMVQSFDDTMRSLSLEYGLQLTQWGERVAVATTNKHDEVLSRDLASLAREAQLAMLEMYEELVTSREGPASQTHYRAGIGRLAGGILLGALGRNDFFTVSGNSLSWGNISMLNGAAHQWHRIAFGAGGRGRGISDTEAINLMGQAVGTIGIEGGPSPSFRMPKGIWLVPGGGKTRGHGPPGADEFYPQNQGKSIEVEVSPGITRTMHNLGREDALAGRGVRAASTGWTGTRGIATHDFFKAGLQKLADPKTGLPEALEAYVYSVTRAWGNASAVHRNVSVPVRVRGVR